MNGVNYEPLLRDMTWSFSRLKTYDQCPAQWYYRYLMQEEDEEQFYASYGSFVHELIARFYTGELSSDELLPEFLQGFSTRVAGERPSAEIERKYLDQGAKYFETFEAFPLTTLAVEKEIETEIEGLKFTGFIDYLGRNEDGGLVIVDHKSADLKPRSKKGKQTQSDRKLDDVLRQLYLYANWVHGEFGEWPAELWLNCFRTGTIIRETFDEAKYTEAVEWVQKEVKKLMKEDLFLPTDDFYYCRWICGQHGNCDLYEEEYGGRRRRR